VPGKNIAVTTVVAILLVVAMLVYLPALTAAPLFDENYLLAWWSWLSKHLFSNDCGAYLLSTGIDARDRNGPLGNLFALVAGGMASGHIGFVHFYSVAIHYCNCLLLYFAVCRTLAGTERYAVATMATFIFAFNPLAPEAVAWAGALPIESGTTFALLAYLAYMKASEKPTNLSLTLAIVFALAAPLCNERLTFILFLPLLLNLKADYRKPSRLFVTYLAACLLTGIAACIYYQPAYNAPEPPKIAALRQGNEDKEQRLTAVSALVLPINKSTNVKYKRIYKTAFFLFIVPAILALIATVLNASYRRKILLTVACLAAFIAITQPPVNLQSLYGARWLYPALPLFSFFAALILASPFYSGFLQQNKLFKAGQYLVSGMMLVLAVLFYCPLTFTQNSSYKSQAKLFARLSKSIKRIAETEKSPYLIVRNLPSELAVAPVLSPFDPVLISAKDSLPLSQNISSGALKDSLKNESWRNLCVHYQKHLFDLIKTDFDPPVSIFDRPFDADSVAFRLTPSITYYDGLVKLSSDRKELHLASSTASGAAISIDCTGLSPLASDFLFVDCALSSNGSEKKKVELHWLTNWNLDWERRDRLTTALVETRGDTRCYFSLRHTGFNTNGRPEQIRLGFPAGEKIKITAIGTQSLSDPSCLYQIPRLSATATTETCSPFAAFTHNYPALNELGMARLCGKNLELAVDISKIAKAKSYRLEVGRADSKFAQDNAEQSESGSTLIDGASSTIQLKRGQFKAAAAVYPLRIFALDEHGAIINRSSDTIYCLVN
jgi:hypothetical protein